MPELGSGFMPTNPPISRDMLVPRCDNCTDQMLTLVDFVLESNSSTPGGLNPIWHCGECEQVYKGRTQEMESRLISEGEVYKIPVTEESNSIKIDLYDPNQLQNSCESLDQVIRGIILEEKLSSQTEDPTITTIHNRLNELELAKDKTLEERVNSFSLE